MHCFTVNFVLHAPMSKDKIVLSRRFVPKYRRFRPRKLQKPSCFICAKTYKEVLKESITYTYTWPLQVATMQRCKLQWSNRREGFFWGVTPPRHEILVFGCPSMLSLMYACSKISYWNNMTLRNNVLVAPLEISIYHNIIVIVKL